MVVAWADQVGFTLYEVERFWRSSGFHTCGSDYDKGHHGTNALVVPCGMKPLEWMKREPPSA